MVFFSFQIPKHVSFHSLKRSWIMIVCLGPTQQTKTGTETETADIGLKGKQSVEIEPFGQMDTLVYSHRIDLTYYCLFPFSFHCRPRKFGDWPITWYSLGKRYLQYISACLFTVPFYVYFYSCYY